MKTKTKIPAWKKLLKYAYDHCNVVSANKAVACGLVKNSKSFRDMIYRLKKNKYALIMNKTPYITPNNPIYRIEFTRAGLEVAHELAGINVAEVKPQDNTQSDNSILTDLQNLYNIRFLDSCGYNNEIDLANMKLLGFANNDDECFEKLKELASNGLIEWSELDNQLFDVKFTLKGFDMLDEAKQREKLVDVKLTQKQINRFISMFRQAIALLEQAAYINK